RLRLGRTKTGIALLALRPLARQGHLVGTLGGPMLVAPSLILSTRRRGSTMKTVSAPASRSFRGSLPHTPRARCVRFVFGVRRLTQHSLPGGLLGLGRTRTGWIAPALPARSHQDDADLRADRSRAYLVSCIRVRSAHGNSL